MLNLYDLRFLLNSIKSLLLVILNYFFLESIFREIHFHEFEYILWKTKESYLILKLKLEIEISFLEILVYLVKNQLIFCMYRKIFNFLFYKINKNLYFIKKNSNFYELTQINIVFCI